MTAQVQDVFRYRRRNYRLAGISTGDLFDPTLLPLRITGTDTGCYRGYVATFALSGRRLVLDGLRANVLMPGKPAPAVNGVLPKPAPASGRFDSVYAGLNYHLEYTGGLLLADDFIAELYVHMGFHPAWKYRKVVELTFDAGTLTGAFDRSARMAELRTTMGVDGGVRSPEKQSILRFILRSFDRRYGR